MVEDKTYQVPMTTVAMVTQQILSDGAVQPCMVEDWTFSVTMTTITMTTKQGRQVPHSALWPPFILIVNENSLRFYTYNKMKQNW